MNELVLREVLVCDQNILFNAADFPWLVTAVVHLKAGGGDVNRRGPIPADAGYVLIELYGRNGRKGQS